MSLYFKNELKRAIFSKSSLAAFLITLVTLLIGFYGTSFYDFSIELDKCKKFYDSADIFLLTRDSGSKSFLGVIAPLLAVLPFSNSYLHDKDSGFLKFIYIRMDKKRYILNRILVNAIASGVIIVSSLLTILIIICLFLGISTNPNSFFDKAGTYMFLYVKSKWLYVIFIFILSFLFNAIFATLGLGLSPFINNKYLSFICPFAIYMLSMTILPYIGLGSHNMSVLFSPSATAQEFYLLVYQIILLALSILLFNLGVKYRNEKDL
ncbi:hypothetical protein SAMN04487886_12472 [Clostridium sp. DSM 8431]|uniref:hypothetical protein n=1 Tax=Clostridium sp. DSM 8431 TaxID=1761781 RepID=UPI0008F23980|nr:hypothetical protein [Clostridium sp. DSM 8431]SFU87212.1 hypothetical protein SAMN04487886_12472 [Clostridium sp. DSM 8431]